MKNSIKQNKLNAHPLFCTSAPGVPQTRVLLSPTFGTLGQQELLRRDTVYPVTT